jgi:hypothetical protein
VRLADTSLCGEGSMIRRLFTIASAVSLLLCVAIVVLWVRSVIVFDRISFDRCGRSLQVSTPNPSIYMSWTSRQYRKPRWERKFASPMRLADSIRVVNYTLTDTAGQPHFYGCLGFFFVPTYLQPGVFVPGGGDCWFTFIGVPFYFLLFLTSLMPAFRMRYWFTHHRRMRDGLCPSCGYDLRASKDRCPECGTAITAKVKVVA